MFTVKITAYRLHPHVDVEDVVPIFQSQHRSPKAASRMLARLISGRTAFAKSIRRSVPADYGARFQVEHDGANYALLRFRKEFCA